MSTTARKLGTLTNAQRARKIARASKLQAEAVQLLSELYDDRRDQSYRMSFRELDAHRAIGRAADAAESAQRVLDLEVLAGNVQL